MSRHDQASASDDHEHTSGEGAEAAGPQNWSEKKIFTTGEAAQVCKVSQQTIIRCFDSGRLTGFRVPGSKFRRIPRDELIRFMRANNIPLDPIEGGKKRILVVDDDPSIIELFNDMFARDARFDVRTAQTGYDAGLLTESFKPQLVLLDYMLPDINGNIVCQRIRAKPEMRDTKIVCVSGVVNQPEIEQLMASGASDFIQKPFDVDLLMRRVCQHLELEQAAAGR